MNATQLTWPGVDQQRAVAACWHLERATQLAIVIRDYPPTRLHMLPSFREHVRIARGYLGAIGFEHHAGIWRTGISRTPTAPDREREQNAERELEAATPPSETGS